MYGTALGNENKQNGGGLKLYFTVWIHDKWHFKNNAHFISWKGFCQ